ncbi:lipopolysaccharide biosynthesis protein [Xylophilus sp. GOD-11R]|uniref:lipopolysaccharide biosynthesis protein n=1 Tax=Xylophilus sp. GOD-11R TaxID=3089814 RepID=UPI00298C4BB5|nr:lipopolysaccharide biosynthesis protein [Xylophilus sp. GOD-11R]WPB58094.1 lipopolysaccharide biosynthesis protein [Xylophilus sp. GOD-11R]
MKQIGKAGVSAAKWSVATTIARFGLQLIAQVILARALGPEIYGLFGMGMVVFTLSNFFATFGFSYGLHQLKEIDDSDIRVAFTWQLLTGIAAGGAMFLAAPWTAQYFHDDRVQFITQWMALACVINSLGSVPGNLMRRSMSFRISGLIQLASYFLGYIGVGVPLALMGAGVSALVAAWMTQATVGWLASYYVVRHPIRLLFKSTHSPELLRMGMAVFFTNLGNWFISTLDRLMIGRYLNAHAMGVYTVGNNLANMPNTLLIGAMQPVFMAAGARVQDEPERLKLAYQQVSSTIWVVLFPFFVMLAFLSPEIVRLLYGPAWIEAVPVLQILFVSMPAFVTWGMSTPVLWNTGRAKFEIFLQLPLLPLAAVAYYLFGRNSIEHATLVAAAVIGARGLVMATAASKILSVRPTQWVVWMVRGALLTAVTLLLPWICLRVYAPPMPAIVALFVGGALGFGTLGAFVIAFPIVLGRDAAMLLLRFFPRLRPRFTKTFPAAPT